MPATAKDRALRLLGVRARSREELRRRLAKAGFPDDEVRAALDDLERVGLVDDAAFARELAGHKLRRAGHGRRSAMSALRAAGVGAEAAEAALDEAAIGHDEEARAEEVARERAPRLAGLDPPVAYRRLLGFLLRRGFEGEAARTAARRVLESGPGGR